MIELTEEMARKMDRASQILSGLARAASKDCSWVRGNAGLHAEILDLQNELREAAATVTGGSDVGAHLTEARTVGNQIRELFQAAEHPEQASPLLTV